MITLVLGGARSGKSALAERLVLAHPGPLVYLATGRADDDDMAERIARHRSTRSGRFDTIESTDLARSLHEAPRRPLLIDALGTWVASQPEFGPPARADEVDGRDTVEPDLAAWWEREVGAVCDALADRARHGAPTVLVSDEVGLGVHPESSAGRRFRDVLGLVNQRVAAVADDVLLVVAGRVLTLDHPDGLFDTDRTDHVDPTDDTNRGGEA